jgi:hypothetical protein
MRGWPAERWQLIDAWLQALVNDKKIDRLRAYIPEAIALLKTDQRIGRRFTEVELELKISGLLGEHPGIQERSLSFSVDSFVQRLAHHRRVVVPGYHRYLKIRQEIIERERDGLARCYQAY